MHKMASGLNTDPPILYELLVYEEWAQDPEPVKCRAAPHTTRSPLLLSPQNLLRYLRHAEWPSEEFINALHSHLSWRISLSPDGQLVAILQDSFLEVRTHADDFTSIVGKASGLRDVFPQLRLLKWHPESNKIAVSSSTGVVTIFDAYCNHLHTIHYSPEHETNAPLNIFVAGIEFVELEKRERKVDEVVVIYSNGILKSFRLPERDSHHEVHYVQLGLTEVSCAIYNSRYNILFVAAHPQITNKVFQDTCYAAGLSAWRVVSDEPYCKMVFPSDEEMKMYQSGGTLWRMISFSKAQGVAVKLSISLNNQYLASLHSCSTIIIWLIPSLRMYRKWSLNADEKTNDNNSMDFDKSPVDIEWRHDEKLIVSRKDGSISVHHVETFEVCYGSGSELLSGHPRISSTINFPGFVALECDTVLLSPSSEETTNDVESSIINTSSEMIQNTIYYITDIDTFQPKKKSTKVIQKIYRMIGIKSITPEELFLRKLENNEYPDALELAQEFGLNSDEVYKKIWRTSAVSANSIRESLNRINNISWVLNECVQRIPDSISGAEDLFQFAYKLTSLESVFEGDVPSFEENGHEAFDISELNDLQREMILTRAMLKNYDDKLRSYRAILGGDPDNDGTFDMAQYGRFRRLPIVESAVHFARQCNTKALEIIFRHYTQDVSPFLLNILENMPETFSPVNYKSLLPQCDGEDNVILWGDSSPPEKDWVQSSIFKPIMPCYMEEITMKDLEPTIFTGPLLSQWYRKRALNIEHRCRLVVNARHFVELAIERNIKGLGDLLADFITLECMVYQLELDIDVSTLMNMTNLQKCVKLLENTNPEEFTSAMLEYFVPFVNRHHIVGDVKFQLYHDFLSYTSQDNLSSSLNFLTYLLEGNVDLVGGPNEIVSLIAECIYVYSNLDVANDSLKVIDDCISWLHSLPDDLRDRKHLLKILSELREETLAAQILAKYRIPMSIKYIHDVKTSDGEPKKIVGKIPLCAIKKFKKHKAMKVFDNCLKDMLSLQEICFVNVQLDSCYEVYALALLSSHSLFLIEHSSTVLCCKKETEYSCCLSFEHSIKLVLEAAETYFEAAANGNDETMNLAKACLFLIKDDHPEINKELDLIQSLRYLNEAGVNLIPIQVRRTEDRMKLINLCLKKDPKLYRKAQFVYKLGAKLRVCGEDVVKRHNLLTEKLAHVAIADGAWSHCIELCTDLVTNEYGKGWEVVFELLQKTKIQDPFTGKLFWCFCAVHAPSRILNELFELRYLRETSVTPLRGPSRDVSIPDYSHASLLNTPDSEDLDDYHLASSDSSHKLDEPSDAEPIPSFCCPFFYSDQNEPQGGQLSEYRVTTPAKCYKPSIYHVLQCTSEETLFSYVESHKFHVDPWIVDSKLLELFEKSMNKDTLTALGFLLCTHNPLTCEDIFEKLPQVPFIYELAIYFFALCSLRGTSQQILIPPYEALHLVNSLSNAEFKSSINKFTKKWESLMQANSLKEEDCGVNYERFMKDDSYKNDTIFGLAMSPGKLDIALDLARKNGISLLDIAITHVEALFLDGEIDAFIKGSGDTSDVASILKSSSDVVIDRFLVHYTNIDGKDYKKLSSFFKLILYLNGGFIIEELAPKEHVKLLKRVESTVPGLDYKDLVSKKVDFLTLMKPFLLETDSVMNSVKLTKSLPRGLKNHVSSSTLYYEFCIHQFQTLCVECSSLKQCTSRFESIFPTLAKLSLEDLRKFVSFSICSPNAVDRMDYVIRRQLLNSLLQWCQGSCESRAYIDEMVGFIQEKLELLNHLWSDDLEDVSSSQCRKYLRDLEKSYYSETDALQRNADLIAIVNEAERDNQLLREELLILRKTVSSLVPSYEILEELTPDSMSPDDSEDVIEAADDLEVGSGDADDQLLFVRQHCDKWISEHSSLEVIDPTDEEVLIQSRLSSTVLAYLLHSEDTQDLEPSGRVGFSGKYDVAETVMESHPSPAFFQLLKGKLELFLKSDVRDKLFLVWLCLSCEPLNLVHLGEEFLSNNIEVGELSRYLHQNPGSVKRLIPIIASTDKFALLTSSLLCDSDTSTLQLIIDALRNNGMFAEAGTLEMLIRRVPDSLRTFSSAFR